MLSRKVTKGYVGVSLNTHDKYVLLQVTTDETSDPSQSRCVMTVEQAKLVSEKLTDQILKLEVIRLDEEPISKIGAGETVVGSSPTASASRYTSRTHLRWIRRNFRDELPLNEEESNRLSNYERSRVERMLPRERGRWREYGRVNDIQIQLEAEIASATITADEFAQRFEDEVVSVRRQLAVEERLDRSTPQEEMKGVIDYVISQGLGWAASADWTNVRIHTGMVSGQYGDKRFRIFTHEEDDACYAGVIGPEGSWREARACYCLEEFKDVIHQDQV
tara:strand:+ start:892 stop:1722 length:831 start_codon:yes stop_codon:yes gene_type:complete